MSKIPLIIHQIWIGIEGKNMPDALSELANSWIQNHCECKYILWGEAELNKLLVNKFPLLIPLMESYNYEIQRIDVYKYLLLYEFGGLYVDLDCECIRPVFHLFEGKGCVLTQNSEDDPFIIGNFFMASTAKNMFIKQVIGNLSNDSSIKIDESAKMHMVLNSTGPLYVTGQYHEYEKKDKVLILDYNHVSPLTPIESRAIMRSGTVEEKANNKLQEAFAVHYFFGMWI